MRTLGFLARIPVSTYAVASCLLVAAVIALSVLGCDSVTDDGGCADNSISPSLKRIMFWGYVAPDHWEPNTGVEIGDIYHPVWYADDSIFVHTGKVEHGVNVVGIFNVAIDPATRTFRTVKSHAFPDVIRDYDYSPATRDFAVTYSRTPSDIQAAWARVSGDSLVLGDIIRDEAWFPLSARIDASGEGVYLYAHDPSTLVNGFYFVRRGASAEDSLVHAVELSVPDARGFDVGDSVLCFGRTDSSGPAHTTITVVKLDGSALPRSVATLRGAFVSASLHPSGTCAIVSLDDFSLPGSVVGLLDLETGAFSKLDVLTRPCSFVTADFACWNPNGNCFAFSASGFDGEGGVYPRQLWSKSCITCS